MKRVALVLGTRPEIIKLAPVIQHLTMSGSLDPFVIATGQHRRMADQAFAPFELTPDVNLDLMTAGQSPNRLLGRLLPALEDALQAAAPVGVIVQGDTTSALAGAVSAFHCKLPVAHVEAGLRTFLPHAPFPEEMNRSVISKIASLHFCPTERARSNLEAEGIDNGIHVVGNTVVDALFEILAKLDRRELSIAREVAELGLESKLVLLVTGHRRESFSGPLGSLCRILLELRDKVPELTIVYPVHLNPNVRETVFELLDNQPRVHLLDPVDYPTLLHLMRTAKLILTDSGGIQEEAPSLATPVLVTRVATERPEAIEAGLAALAPLEQPEAVVHMALETLRKERPAAAARDNPFGDGSAAARITALLEDAWGGRQR